VSLAALRKVATAIPSNSLSHDVRIHTQWKIENVKYRSGNMSDSMIPSITSQMQSFKKIVNESKTRILMGPAFESSKPSARIKFVQAN
jgi:hypothetical protein